MQEKNTKKLFSASVWAALPLFVYMLISLISSVIVASAWVIANDMLSYSGGDFASLEQVLMDKLSSQYDTITIISMIVEYVIMIPVFALMMFRDEKMLVFEGKLRKAEKIPAVWYQLIILAGAAFSIGGSNLISLSGLNNVSEGYQTTEAVFNSISLPAQLVLFGLVSPLMEELLFRGLIYKRFRMVQSLIMSMIWSSLVFALLHANMVQGIYAFFMGLVLSFVYYRYGTILAPILLHMSANIVSLVFSSLVPKYPGLGSFFGVTFLCFALIIACLYLEEVYVRPLSVDVFILDKPEKKHFWEEDEK